MSGEGFRRGIGKLVRGDEEGVGRRVEHAGFVEIRSARVMDQELESRRGTEKVEEGVVVYEKGLDLRRIWRYQGWSGHGQSRTGRMAEQRAYCHNASLCRLIRCQLRVSDHVRWAEPGLGEDECDAEADEGLSRLSESDLLESEKETLDCIWSAVLGL